MTDNWKRVALEKDEEPKGETMSENTAIIGEKVENNVPVVDNFIVEVPDIPMPEMAQVSNEIVEDECKGAFRLAFVGSGQGGSRIAEAFWKLGYRRVCCVNTTGQDLAAINIPEANKLVMDIGSGGAGKDPTKGETAAKKYYEDIYDLMRRCFGKKFDRIIVCIGAGGGTGSGSSNILIDIAHDIARSFKVEEESGQPAVGVLVSLPKVSEGAKVNENAYNLLESLFVKVGKGKGKQDNRTISPLIIVDNDRVESIYPNLSVTQFWDVANKSISSLLHLFNSIAIQDSDYTTFDRADLEDILSSGVVSFGACPIRKWDTMTDISFSIRDNLKNNVLVGGFDTASARAAACVFIGHTEVLTKIPQSYLEHGFEMLTRIMRQGGVLHRGIYKGSKAGLVVYTMLGELGRPEERMSEIARIAGNRR
jgi:cell division GTPase FtsZ